MNSDEDVELDDEPKPIICESPNITNDDIEPEDEEEVKTDEGDEEEIEENNNVELGLDNVQLTFESTFGTTTAAPKERSKRYTSYENEENEDDDDEEIEQPLEDIDLEAKEELDIGGLMANNEFEHGIEKDEVKEDILDSRIKVTDKMLEEEVKTPV